MLQEQTCTTVHGGYVNVPVMVISILPVKYIFPCNYYIVELGDSENSTLKLNLVISKSSRCSYCLVILVRIDSVVREMSQTTLSFTHEDPFVCFLNFGRGSFETFGVTWKRTIFQLTTYQW